MNKRRSNIFSLLQPSQADDYSTNTFKAPVSLRSLPLYQHRPLPPGPFIRILCLLPAVEKASPLRCTLITEKINIGSTYVALSYCWGATIASRPIDCHGYKLLVTPNCEAALRELRLPDQQRLLWIDSICIDQTSDEERGHQVALMGEIYKAARWVNVWLGESDDQTDQAFQALRTLGQGPSAMNRGCHQAIPRLEYDFSEPMIKNLSSLFERPWFHRLWTVQEVTLPKTHNVFVYYGHSNYPWIWLMNAAAYLGMYPKFQGRWDAATRLQQLVASQLMLERAHWDRLNSGSSSTGYTPLHNGLSSQTALLILTTAREKQSTRPEDRVYSLYSVFKELGVQLPLPDYRKPVTRIFAEAAIACIEKDRSLDILLKALSDVRHPGLPSWVPDWSSPGWDHADTRRNILQLNSTAAGMSTSSWSFADDRRLIAPGLIIDTIRDSGPTLHFSDRLNQSMKTQHLPSSEMERGQLSDELTECFEVFGRWIELAKDHAVYPTPELQVSAFLRTVFYDGGNPSRKALKLELLMRWWNLITGDDIEDGVPVSTLCACMTVWHQAMDLPIWLYHLSSLRCARNMSFFTTERGVYGIAAKTVRKGDKVGLIAGVRVPVILRVAQGGVYEYIGYASVDKYMHGEAWKAEKMKDIILT